MANPHSHDDHAAETGPWPMGWALAFGAGVLAALLASAIGGASGGAGLVVGLLSFGVFGVLLGAGGVERTAPPHQDDHAHGGGHH